MEKTCAHFTLGVESSLVLLSLAVSPAAAHASGHGPVFGAATPTLGKGGWAFDQAWMGQRMDGPADTGAILRSMISFGITEKVQISGSVPVPLGGSGGLPSGRMSAMMSGNRDVEALLGWRFQTRPVGEGARIESTVYVGALVPTDARRGPVRRPRPVMSQSPAAMRPGRTTSGRARATSGTPSGPPIALAPSPRIRSSTASARPRGAGTIRNRI